MSRLWKIAALPALALGFVLAATAEAQAHTVEITASALNVRAGPGTNHRVLTTVRRGQRYNVLATNGNWYRIRASATGWISRSYTRAVSAPSTTHTVTASRLNVRSGAGTNYRVLGTLSRGTRVAVNGSSGVWRRIAYGSGNGWVHSAYLATGATAPAPAPPSRPTSPAGFVQLRASGPGFYAYGVASKRWGRPAVIYAVERIGARWVGQGPRMGVGNISLRNGGYMAPHTSHRQGKDVDVRPVRTSGEGPVTISQAAYSRVRTQRLINLFRANIPMRTVLFNDRRTTGTAYWVGHHNHFHASAR